MAARPAAATVPSILRPAVAAPLPLSLLVELLDELLEEADADGLVLDLLEPVGVADEAFGVAETSLALPPAAARAEEALAADADSSSSVGPSKVVSPLPGKLLVS